MNSNLSSLLEKKWVVPSVVGVLSFGGGVAAGYFLGKRNEVVFEINYGDLVDPVDVEDENQMNLFDQIAEDYTMPAATETYEMNSTYEELVRTIEPTPDEPVETVNVFSGVEDDWDWEAELSSRSSEAPYIIHQEEFIANETGFRQETMTYYVVDDIMADPQDTPIYNYAGLMGELKFGHGSRDKNVVYIRNEAIHMEWEILRHEASYQLEVLGDQMEADAVEELRHSVLKFRPE